MNASTNATIAAALAHAAAEVPRFGNLTILDFTTNLSVLAFDPSITNITILDGAIDNLFSPEIFSVSQVCAYAMSGSYGFLNRLLFYCLLLFALVSRWHSWLSAAALGIAMTYSTVACVHCFALLIRYKYSPLNTDELYEDPTYYGDVDLFGIFPILMSASIMIPPLLNWSYALRMKEVHNARPIVILWGLLVFTALVPTMFKLWNGAFPFVIAGVASCTLNDKIGCNPAQFTAGIGTNLFRDMYDLCDCFDTSLLLERRASNISTGNRFGRLFTVNFWFLTIVIVHGFLGLVEAHWTQAEVRNKLFLFFGGRTEYCSRHGLGSKIRYAVGQLFTTALYLLAIFLAFVSPVAFVISTVVNEIETWQWPGVAADDAGLWGPWVGAAFAIIAAIMQEYWHEWQKFLILALHTAFYLVRGNREHRTKHRRERSTDDSISANVLAFFVQVIKPLRWALHMIHAFWKRIVLELQDFYYWLKDPVNMSLHEPYYWYPHLHQVFYDVKIHTAACDQCQEREELISYQCDDCALRYCSSCWEGKKKHGDAHLKNEPHPQEIQLGKIATNVSRIDIEPGNPSREELRFEPHTSPLGLIHSKTTPVGSPELAPPFSFNTTPPATGDNPHAGMPDERAEGDHQGSAFRPSYRRTSTDSLKAEAKLPPLQTDHLHSPQQPSPISPVNSSYSPQTRKSSVADKQLPTVPPTAA